MKRVAFIFVLAVFLPALVLGGLALRSLRDQRLAFERQRLQLAQDSADRLAAALAADVDELQRDFGRQAEALISTNTPSAAAWGFDERLRQVWPLAEVGFAVRLGLDLCSPSVQDGRETSREFHRLNRSFLAGQECIEVFAVTPKGRISLSSASPTPTPGPTFVPADMFRNVVPLEGGKDPSDANRSRLQTSATDFRRLVGDAQEGIIARLLSDHLSVLVWHRSARDSELVFGAQLDLGRLVSRLGPLIATEPAFSSQFGVALLDEHALPLLRIPALFSTASWRRPLVAAEVGEALPHWEVAVYELDPGRPASAAAVLRWTLGALVAGLLAAIGVGGWLVVHDLQREMVTARRKTDFVSNVSHELKTPLTSIRMFAELLAEDRVADPDRRRQHLQVIASEAGRLTRLVNNVLDFARLDRGGHRLQRQSVDLAALVQETLASHEPNLVASGLTVHTGLPGSQVIVHGDRDALAQVFLNLLSNVEKYAAEGGEVTVGLEALPAAGGTRARVALSVADRGPGVPAGCEERIFNEFFRAHDALNTGVSGAGLGLTLVRRTARDHGGEVRYASRPGGGSVFTLELPAA